MLPGTDGFGVCEIIRRESDVPIIMLTALAGEAEVNFRKRGQNAFWRTQAAIPHKMN